MPPTSGLILFHQGHSAEDQEKGPADRNASSRMEATQAIDIPLKPCLPSPQEETHMDDDALEAIGTLLAAIGGIMERNGICSTMTLAETIGGVALMTHQAGEQYHRRATYLGQWAHMVRAAALGPDGVDEPVAH